MSLPAAALLLGRLLAAPIAADSLAGPGGVSALAPRLVLSVQPWRRLLARLREEGAFTPRSAGLPARRALSRRSQGSGRDAALWGFATPEGGFEPVLVTLASEERRALPPGPSRGAGWEAEVWELRLRLDGSLIEASRYSKVLAEGGALLELRRHPLAPGDPRIAEALRAELGFWTG